jgi:hypothetical protein
MCDILVARVFNPLYHLDVLFHLSSVGRLHDRNLLTLHAMTSKVIKERREQILQATAAAAPEDCDAVGEKKHIAQVIALFFQEVRQSRRYRLLHNFCGSWLCSHYVTT